VATGVDVDQVVLRSGEVAAAPPPPKVTVSRTRTTRTAIVAPCPSGCWLILGEGYNNGWDATGGGVALGAPRQISGGFNGWWLPASTTPTTVTMSWTPQRTMWIGMAVAALAVLGCLILIRRDREVAELPSLPVPVAAWPPVPTSRGGAVAVAAALVALSVLCIAPQYGVYAAAVGVLVVLLKRPLVAGVAAVVVSAAIGALIVRRQVLYRYFANPDWPGQFADLHQLGLFVVILLLAGGLVDDCRIDEPQQLA
jgi:arabinofuranan 3-O-arabinosyltransferase